MKSARISGFILGERNEMRMLSILFADSWRTGNLAGVLAVTRLLFFVAFG
jgi:hypothetical protein